MSLPKPVNEHDLCAMTISIDDLEKMVRRIGTAAALEVCNTDGLNEAARVYAMHRVIEIMMEHVAHSLRAEVLKDQFTRDVLNNRGAQDASKE